MEICIEKDSCSTDPGVLAKTLLDDPQFVEALRTDIIDGYKIDLKTGFSKD
jgi:hypothetical protein